jgi:3-oxoacyl-(acyl-carrier-protein) synthase
VVVTGYGAVTPLGHSVDETWAAPTEEIRAAGVVPQ